MRYNLLPGARGGVRGAGAVKLQLQPMLAGRDFHATIQLHQRPWWTMSSQTSDTISLSAPECPVPLILSHNADRFNVNACWWYNFTFRVERSRGYPDREDLWTPGILEFTLKPGVPVGFIASTKFVAWAKAEELIQAEAARQEKLAYLSQSMAAGADSFLTDRGWPRINSS